MGGARATASYMSYRAANISKRRVGQLPSYPTRYLYISTITYQRYPLRERVRNLRPCRQKPSPLCPRSA